MSNPTPPAHLLSSYIMAQLVQAMPMTKVEFERSYFEVKGSGQKDTPQTPGYLVQTEDGYCRWVEKSVFEKSARAILNTEAAPTPAAEIAGSVAQRAAQAAQAAKVAEEAQKAKELAEKEEADRVAAAAAVAAEEEARGAAAAASDGDTYDAPEETRAVDPDGDAEDAGKIE